MPSKNFKGWNKQSVENLTNKVKIVGEVEPKVIRLNIKPLSVNEAFTGVRYKTDEYKSYAKEVLLSLKPMKIPDGKLEITYLFGLSNSGADLDNCVKQFQDLLAKKYGFNDSRIYRFKAEKEDVKKGKEFIEFEIIKYEHRNNNN